MKKILLMLVLAATTTTLSAKEPFKSADAEIQKFEMIDELHAKFTLDFVNIFSSYFDDEYERYLKLGYPKITKDEFNDKGPGGLIVINKNKKLRELTTNADTVYEAYCVNSKYANKDGLVSLSLSEFSTVLDRKFGNLEGREAVSNKHGHCYSFDGDTVSIKYDGKVLKRISFVWMP